MESAISDAKGLVQASFSLDEDNVARIMASWNRLAVDAVQFQVGTLANGSPLRSILDEIGGELSGKLGNELTTGLAAGTNPREVARLMRQHVDFSKRRAENIARTEMIRSYRAATIANFQANAHVVKGWRWITAFDGRQCIACAMMHGSLHKIDEPMNSHVACRCSAAPETVTLRELGIDGVDEPEPPVQEGDGLKWFMAQPADTQRDMLGDAMYNAWLAGKVTPEQFYTIRRDPVWGDAPTPASLRDVLGTEAEAFYG